MLRFFNRKHIVITTLVCPKCHDELFSEYIHHLVWCRCRECGLDGCSTKIERIEYDQSTDTIRPEVEYHECRILTNIFPFKLKKTKKYETYLSKYVPGWIMTRLNVIFMCKVGQKLGLDVVNTIINFMLKPIEIDISGDFVVNGEIILKECEKNEDDDMVVLDLSRRPNVMNIPSEGSVYLVNKNLEIIKLIYNTYSPDEIHQLHMKHFLWKQGENPWTY